MCVIAEQSISKLIFRVNYLLLALNGEISDFGESYYYIWHQGTDASFPTTTDETTNGKIKNSIWRQKHAHTGSLSVLFPGSWTKLDVMRCTHDL